MPNSVTHPNSDIPNSPNSDTQAVYCGWDGQIHFDRNLNSSKRTDNSTCQNLVSSTIT